MNILIKILMGIGAIIALLLIIAAFVKNEYTIQREIVINKPKSEVFDYIKYLKNQDHYNKWVMIDPAMKKDYKGIDGTVGFIYAWDGNDKAGKGEQEIKRINDGDKLDLEIRFIKPFEGIAQTYITTESAAGNQTKVNWVMNGSSKYPMNITNLFIDNMLGNDLLTSLGMLKANLEKKAGV